MNPIQRTPLGYIETNEQKRLNDARELGIPWKKWGPYLSERQWGTVREDYSRYEVAKEIERRLAGIFVRNANGRRPAYGGTKKFQEDPHWKDYILYYEYFHGDNGAGLGASHQTGWTGVIARLMDIFARGTAADWLHVSKGELAAQMTREQVAG